MTRTGYKDARAEKAEPKFVPHGDAPPANMSLVLVVATAPVNRVVVSGIVERAGLRVAVCDPGGVSAALAESCPGMVILDTGPDNSECETVIRDLSIRREASLKGLPLVVALSSVNARPQEFGADAVDAVVAKPITPERLQPVMSRLIEQTAA